MVLSQFRVAGEMAASTKEAFLDRPHLVDEAPGFLWPEVVGLSISLPARIPTGREVIEKIRGDGGGGRPAVLVGGLALNQLDGRIWRDMGADPWSANAKAALREAS